MKAFLKIAALIALVMLILACFGAGLFWYNWHENKPAKVISTQLSSTPGKIGVPLDLTITVQTPWYRKVVEPIQLLNDEEVSLTKDTTVTRSGLKLSGASWQIKARLIPFKEGELQNLKMAVGLSPDRQKKQKTLEIPLPNLNVAASGPVEKSAVALKDTMSAADLMNSQKNGQEEAGNWLWPTIIAVIILTIIVIFIKLRTKNVRIPKPWEVARHSLVELKKDLSLQDEIFFVKLSDILRQYIERRFALPATEKTSEEFIQQLRCDTILSEQQRRALERFLGTADMVKFAKMRSNEKQKNDCLAMADNFVNETVPHAQEKQ